MTVAGDRLRLLYDWASAQDARRRLTLWVTVALLLHAGAYLLFRITYPSADLVRISDATFYVLLPGSPQAKKIAPFLADKDPALFAPEDAHGRNLPVPTTPAYQPSYAVATAQLLPLPDPPVRILPPLIRDVGPIPMPEPIVTRRTSTPATETQIVFSASLQARAPQDRPKKPFVARPGDQLAPEHFHLAVAPDGRVLHVIKDTEPSSRMLGTDNRALDDETSRYLMKLRFQHSSEGKITWGSATFHWGLDVKRKELR